ncbi:hypothetical protein [uncultured Desulfobulbus sp.]|uniref:hypothetical protein n=1 Tax=uncultured Desulfobulbus sp. TaxID=239745 RepID=UPI0029C90D2E|nr:hypothetical protein [uncultured Desulfobulbus sp.]
MMAVQQFWNELSRKSGRVGAIASTQIQRDVDAWLMSARWWTGLREKIHEHELANLPGIASQEDKSCFPQGCFMAGNKLDE